MIWLLKPTAPPNPKRKVTLPAIPAALRRTFDPTPSKAQPPEARPPEAQPPEAQLPEAQAHEHPRYDQECEKGEPAGQG